MPTAIIQFTYLTGLDVYLKKLTDILHYTLSEFYIPAVPVFWLYPFGSIWFYTLMGCGGFFHSWMLHILKNRFFQCYVIFLVFTMLIMLLIFQIPTHFQTASVHTYHLHFSELFWSVFEIFPLKYKFNCSSAFVQQVPHEYFFFFVYRIEIKVRSTTDAWHTYHLYVIWHNENIPSPTIAALYLRPISNKCMTLWLFIVWGK